MQKYRVRHSCGKKMGKMENGVLLWVVENGYIGGRIWCHEHISFYKFWQVQ